MAPPERSARRPASVPPTLEYWSLLPHRFERTPGGGPLPLDAGVMHPSWRLGAHPINRSLQEKVEKLLTAKPALKSVRFALADLTPDRMHPQFAGNKEAEQVFTGSLAKTACVYAAFQLQYDLNVIATANPALKTAAALFDAAWQDWLKTQVLDPKEKATKLANGLGVQGELVLKGGGRVAMAYGDWNPKHKNPRKDASPNLEAIFDVDTSKSPLAVTFKKTRDTMMLAAIAPDNETDFLLDPKQSPGFKKFMKKIKPDLTIDTLNPAVRDLLKVDCKDGVPFYERLLMMGDQSNNDASRSCILDVGYLYLASSLWQSELFLPDGGGLWLSGTYATQYGGGPGWIESPVPTPGGWANHFQCVTPVAAARLMTLLAQNRLISAASSAGMKAIFDKKRDGVKYPNGSRWMARSFIGDHLAYQFEPSRKDADPYPLDEIYSKIGIGGQNERSDIAFVSHKKHGKKLEYVLAFISLPDKDWGLLTDLIPGLDNCILQNNP